MHELFRTQPTRVHSGFTLLELLVVIAIIGILAAVVLASTGESRDAARKAEAEQELRAFATAVELYRLANDGAYPPDTDRGVPNGLERYLGNGEWPEGPWPNTVYDFDAYTTSGGDEIVQIGLRFCNASGECTFPNAEWAEGFLVSSQLIYCLEGPCQSHESEDRDYPGWCVNCSCKDLAECHGS